MKVKEVYVTQENPAEIFRIIEEELVANPNTQIYIDYDIYNILYLNGSDYGVFHENYSKTFHYYHDREDDFGGEDWLALHEEKKNRFSKTIARASFICNCKGYMQLVEFHSSKVKDYTHYLAGFEQLLLIHIQK